MTSRHSIASLPQPAKEVPCPHADCELVAQLDRPFEENANGFHYFSYTCPGAGAKGWNPNHHYSGLKRRYDCARCEEPHVNHIRVESLEHGQYLVCPSLLMIVSFQLDAHRFLGEQLEVYK